MYKHSQLGSLIIVSMVLLFGILLVALNIVYDNTYSILITTILVLTLALFYKLTVSVDDTRIIISFGMGLIRKKFPLNKIKSCKIVKNRWYHGWGIHYSQDGWVWNVSGWDAIELQFKNGKKARIGTDDAIKLQKYISSKIK